MDRKTRVLRNRGFALVGALWAVMVLSLAASSVVTTSLTEARLTRSRIKSAELSAAADAVVNIVLVRLLSLDLAAAVPVDGTPFSMTFGDYTATVSVQDEAGKVDLNLADRDLLAGLIESTGAVPTIAGTVADRILDWREPGAGKRLLGAKMEDYRAVGIAYGPRNGPFEAIEEFRLVAGVTPDLYNAVAPFITVYGQSDWPDREMASEDILRALPGMKRSEVDAALLARAGGGERQFALSRARLGSVPSISVLMRGAATETRRIATVRLTGTLRDPIWIYKRL